METAKTEALRLAEGLKYFLLLNGEESCTRYLQSASRKRQRKNFSTCSNLTASPKVVDVRLYNNSQLLGFSKYPDIEFFLRKISDIDYIQDLHFAPTEKILQCYKKKYITWRQYELEFAELMASRGIDEYIRKNYSDAENICLLCTEQSPVNCHRRLVAERIVKVLGDVEIIHL